MVEGMEGGMVRMNDHLELLLEDAGRWWEGADGFLHCASAIMSVDRREKGSALLAGFHAVAMSWTAPFPDPEWSVSGLRTQTNN